MSKEKFPTRIAVTIDENGTGPVADRLLAWPNLAKADQGLVAIYELVEEFETQDVKRKRRVGTKQWFY